jgi:penicillin-binding protein 1A
VFPNDGLRVTPRLIRKVSNADSITLWEEPPAVNEVIDRETARTMMTLLRAVTRFGTGAAAAQLNHPLGGKTGTTSDYTDAWFLGFSPSITCGVWVGYDSRQSLGDKETGAKAALPIWMNVMRVAIAGKDDEQFLSDSPESRTVKAAAEMPAKPGAANAAVASREAVPPSSPLKVSAGAGLPVAKPPTSSLARSVIANAVNKPATTPLLPAPGAKPAAKPGAPLGQPWPN